MDIQEMTNILHEALGRVEAVGLTLGLDLLNLAELLGTQLKDMGIDLVHAAETGQAQQSRA
jgi:hypothetical protein